MISISCAVESREPAAAATKHARPPPTAANKAQKQHGSFSFVTHANHRRRSFAPTPARGVVKAARPTPTLQPRQIPGAAEAERAKAQNDHASSGRREQVGARPIEFGNGTAAVLLPRAAPEIPARSELFRERQQGTPKSPARGPQAKARLAWEARTPTRAERLDDTSRWQHGVPPAVGDVGRSSDKADTLGQLRMRSTDMEMPSASHGQGPGITRLAHHAPQTDVASPGGPAVLSDVSRGTPATSLPSTKFFVLPLLNPCSGVHMQ